MKWKQSQTQHLSTQQQHCQHHRRHHHHQHHHQQHQQQQARTPRPAGASSALRLFYLNLNTFKYYILVLVLHRFRYILYSCAMLLVFVVFAPAASFPRAAFGRWWRQSPPLCKGPNLSMRCVFWSIWAVKRGCENGSTMLSLRPLEKIL